MTVERLNNVQAMLNAAGAATLVAIGLLAWEFVPLQVGRGCGQYELEVEIDYAGPLPQAIACGPFSSRESAAACVADSGPTLSGWEWVAKPYDGRPLTVLVPASTYTSPLGRVIARYQFRYLGLVAVYEGDRAVGVVVEIPDRLSSKEMTVSLP